MGTTYVVVCDLGLDGFDRQAAGRAAARRLHAALRRVVRADGRVRSTRLRLRSGTAELSLVVAGRTSHLALDVAAAHLRAAFAATGLTGVDPAAVHPEVQPVSTSSAGGRRGRRRTALPAGPTFPGWAEVAAETRRRSRPARPLPPLAVALGGHAPVIDLR